MEFCEKMQELRKSKGITQEELAEALYVSRTAVSKWESGRGYPSIDSLREIASFYGVTIDELLSGDKLLSVAEKENRANISNVCNTFAGIMDILAVMLIILPLYPKPVQGYIYSVNLLLYTDTSDFNLMMYWIIYILFIIIGTVKIVLTGIGVEKGQKALTRVSMGLSIASVLFLSLTREAYAVSFLFILFIIKVIFLTKNLWKKV